MNLKFSIMIVELSTKNWLGNYGSHVKHFNSENHLSNYLRVMSRNEIQYKIIGHKVITN